MSTKPGKNPKQSDAENSSDKESTASGGLRSPGNNSGSQDGLIRPYKLYEENKLGMELEKTLKKGEFVRVDTIEQVYKVGKDVVPCEPRLDKNGNPIPPSRAAKFGIRKSDMRRCVLKIRNKKRGFINSKETEDWMSMMKILNNLSGGPGNGKDRKLTRISHIHDILEDDANFYASMEYVQGRDLFDFHAEESPATSPNRTDITRKLVREMLLATKELHDFGLVHRDLKLENVVLDEELGENSGIKGETKKEPLPGSKAYLQKKDPKNPQFLLKIIDFDTVEVWKPKSIVAHVMGTDQYIAPEVYAGVVTPSCDVWAIGVMMFVLWTGHFPFPSALFVDGPGENTVGHPSMEIVRNNIRGHKVDFNSIAWSKNRDAKDFVKKCFLSDHNRRITIDQALRHPFVAGIE